MTTPLEKVREAAKTGKALASPKVREQSGSPKKTLFSSSPKHAGCLPLAFSAATQAAAGSPDKSSSSRAGTSAPELAASPRAYLEGLKAGNLTYGILRDQTTANAGNYPAAWISQVQASLEVVVGKLLELAPTVLAAMPKKDLNRLFPAAGYDEGFDWKPFNDLCTGLWPAFSGQVIALASLPPRTMGLLAEFRAELGGLPVFLDLEPAARNKTVSDALFNLLIWNGIFSPLTQSVPEQYQRLVNGFCAYVKAACGMQAQTRGAIGGAIASMVPDEQVEQCAAFLAALMQQVERIATIRTVRFQDDHDNHALNREREKNVDRHFAQTWESRDDDYAQVVRQGNYALIDGKGKKTPCKSYRDLKAYVGPGDKQSLPEVVLHLAGERIKNFLCNTYLYKTKNPLFIDAQGRRVDPVPTLETAFVLRRDADRENRITVMFSCVDHAVKTAMLVGPGDEDLEMEATPVFQASLEFHGEMHFYPNEEFEVGNIQLTGQNFHMFE